MGILVRSGPLSDAEVQRKIADHFVPVALDQIQFGILWGDIDKTSSQTPGGSPTWVRPAVDGGEVERLSQIVRQAPMSQGIWLTTSEGRVLRNYYGVTARSLLATINAAVRDWNELASGPALPLAATRNEPRHGNPPADSVRLRFCGRLADGTSSDIFRDFAWTPTAAWTDWLDQPVDVGRQIEVPKPLVELIASRLYPGELRLVVRAEELKSASAAVTVRQVVDGVVHGEIAGIVEMDGTFPFSPRRRLHQATLLGEISWRTQPPELIGLRLVSDGHWQGEYPGGKLAAAAEIYPGGSAREPLAMSEPMRILFLVEAGEARDVRSN